MYRSNVYELWRFVSGVALEWHFTCDFSVTKAEGGRCEGVDHTRVNGVVVSYIK